MVQGLVSEQSTGGPAVHCPLWHVSLSVHLLLSVQGVPSCRFVRAHC